MGPQALARQKLTNANILESDEVAIINYGTELVVKNFKSFVFFFKKKVYSAPPLFRPRLPKTPKPSPVKKISNPDPSLDAQGKVDDQLPESRSEAGLLNHEKVTSDQH